MAAIPREAVQASNEQIEAAFDEVAGIGLNVDPEYGCEVTFGPAEEIDQFRTRRKEWREPGRVEKDTGDVLVIRNAQAFKGQRRRDVALIRFGEHCAIFGLDGD